MIKVLDIICQLTGTDDTGTYDPKVKECQTCNSAKMCQAKFDEAKLEEARQMYLDGQKMAEEAQMLIDTARKEFERQATSNQITKYQYAHLVFSKVYFKEQVNYPKAKLLKVFSPEQLENCAEIKPAYWQNRITDLLKDKKNNG